MPEWFEAQKVGRSLLAMALSGGGNFVHLYQEMMEREPLVIYNTIANVIGVSLFAPDAEFPRWNSRRGNRTDLCYNRTTVFRLLRALDDDYKQLEALHMSGSSGYAPVLRRIRKTRCARPEQLVERDLCNHPTRKCSY
eukprot:TRINITY_DN42404_c0_g1_i2.p1 TRINITY_DN42404_c0_g1~~TRINITY_DN42404_c0_g1_i2.p1  ORF type:complete len:138 (-),score=8.45 TRINITY_DN42404_c0_g1_i2:11-424(-)